MPPMYKDLVWNRTALTNFDPDGGPNEFGAVDGFWSLTHDDKGTASWAVEPCGTTGKGLHFKGSGNSDWGAMMEAAFMFYTQPIDTNGSTGIAFTMESTASVIVRVNEPENSPVFCLCNDATPGQDCYAGFGVSVAPLAFPMTVSLPWAFFTKPTWGYHAPGKVAVDPSRLLSLVIGVDQTAGDFDICIDDIRFTY
jgi:hypothetical protein